MKKEQGESDAVQSQDDEGAPLSQSILPGRQTSRKELFKEETKKTTVKTETVKARILADFEEEPEEGELVVIESESEIDDPLTQLPATPEK